MLDIKPGDVDSNKNVVQIRCPRVLLELQAFSKTTSLETWHQNDYHDKVLQFYSRYIFSVLSYLRLNLKRDVQESMTLIRSPINGITVSLIRRKGGVWNAKIEPFDSCADRFIDYDWHLDYALLRGTASALKSMRIQLLNVKPVNSSWWFGAQVRFECGLCKVALQGVAKKDQRQDMTYLLHHILPA